MPRVATPLTDSKIKSLKPRDTRYRVTDSDGLLLEVMPSGTRFWRYRYTLNGVRSAPLTIGEYPHISLAAARKQRDEWAALVAMGKSPKLAVQEAKAGRLNTVAAFGLVWLGEQIEGKSESYKTTMTRIMNKDIFPFMGVMPLEEVTPADVMALCDKIKARGSPKMALLTRNVLSRMFDFAIARQLATSNPARALPARFISTQTSRTRVLSGKEIGDLMRAIYASDMRRAFKLGLHLLLLTMNRKTELIEAEWSEFDLTNGVWDIPAERMKQTRPHRVYLSSFALELLQELQALSKGSAYVLPTTWGNIDKPISKSTLNQAVKAMGFEMESFVLHDFRRTASTHLHEMGLPSDAIEKALAHKIHGIRGVYNLAEYAEQRKAVMQTWGKFVSAHINGATVLPLFKTA